MLEAKESLKSVKEPRTAGVEPVERLAKVFVLPTPKKQSTGFAAGGYTPRLTKTTNEDNLRGPGLDFQTYETFQSTGSDSTLCSDPNPPECCCEGTSDDLLEGVATQLDFLDQGDLRRAHELEQFKRGQKAERECELYALRCEINEALDNGVETDELLELDDRDVMHTTINRVRRELGLGD